MNVFHISDLFYHISGFLDEKSLFTLEITNKYFNDSVKDMTWIWDKILLNRTGGYSVLRPSINPYTYIKKINRSKHRYHTKVYHHMVLRMDCLRELLAEHAGLGWCFRTQ